MPTLPFILITPDDYVTTDHSDDTDDLNTFEPITSNTIQFPKWPDSKPDAESNATSTATNFEHLKNLVIDLCSQIQSAYPNSQLIKKAVLIHKRFVFIDIPSEFDKSLALCIQKFNEQHNSEKIITLLNSQTVNRELSMFSPELLNELESWPGVLYGQLSMDDYRTIDSLEKCVNHITSLKKIEKSMGIKSKTTKTIKTKQISFKQAYSDWMIECQITKAKNQEKLESLNQSWRDLISDRKQLDLKISEVRKELQAIKNEYVAPPAPRREDFME